MHSSGNMKINRSLILDLRKQQSWSQDELAVASGLNLRTLQSRKALAAAFNIDVSDLDSPEETMTTQFEYRVVRFDMKWNALGSKLGTDFTAMEREMNALGKEGWELARMSEILAGTVSTVALIATFKRQGVKS
jgi:transcriptional regulator with XRE-family HTH domain